MCVFMRIHWQERASYMKYEPRVSQFVLDSELVKCLKRSHKIEQKWLQSTL